MPLRKWRCRTLAVCPTRDRQACFRKRWSVVMTGINRHSSQLMCPAREVHMPVLLLSTLPQSSMSLPTLIRRHLLLSIRWKRPWWEMLWAQPSMTLKWVFSYMETHRQAPARCPRPKAREERGFQPTSRASRLSRGSWSQRMDQHLTSSKRGLKSSKRLRLFRISLISASNFTRWTILRRMAAKNRLLMISAPILWRNSNSSPVLTSKSSGKV